MGAAHSELACTIWAHIRDEGGYWAAREIAEEFAIQVEISERYLRNMFARAHLTRRDDAPRKHGKGFVYGFTRSCVPLPGQSAEPLEGKQ